MTSRRSNLLTARRVWLDGIFYLAGSAVYATAVNFFIAPNRIAPGGVTGIATLLNHLFGTPIGVFILLANIPLLVLTWRNISRGLAIRTAIVTVLVSVMIDVSAPYIPAFEGDMVLTAAFGGVLSGAGIGMIYLRGATTGGSELVARLIGQKLRHFSIGRLILIVDALVVVSAAVVYKQVESALYSIVLLYLSTSVMDGLVYGSYKGRMLLIITKREADVTAGILEKIGRGVTKLKAQGAYTGAERGVLMCALRPSEVYALRSLVMDIDPEAFIVITASEEIHGEGFQQMRN